MKPFKPTYLYVKTHTQTGLKYFGKTTADPFRYYGSGNYWRAHLKKHGYSITTEIIGYFTCKEECIAAAIKFSTEHNIVHAVDENNKKIWANQIIENGTDGGATGRANYKPHSEETKRRLSELNKGKLPWNTGKRGVTPGNTRPRSDKTKQLLRVANLGRKQPQEVIDRRAAKLKGHIVTEETRQKISAARKGKKLSPATIEKLKNRIVTDATRQKIKVARQKQIFTEETRKKLSGKVIVIDKAGITKKILKEEYYSQFGPKENWEYVAHNSADGKLRKLHGPNNKDLSSMRR